MTAAQASTLREVEDLVREAQTLFESSTPLNSHMTALLDRLYKFCIGCFELNDKVRGRFAYRVIPIFQHYHGESTMVLRLWITLGCNGNTLQLREMALNKALWMADAVHGRNSRSSFGVACKLADLFLTQSKYGLAEPFFRMAYEIDPADAYVQLNFIKVLMRVGKHQEALKVLESAADGLLEAVSSECTSDARRESYHCGH